MRKNILLIMGLSIFLLTGLSTSSFFLQDTLARIIKDNNHTPSQLNFALAHDNKVALIYAWQQTKHGSKLWQNIGRKLAKTEGKIAYQLAEFYLDESKTIFSDSEQAILWYQQAIRLKFHKASIALARLYFYQGYTQKAHALLNRLPLQTLIKNEDSTVVVAVVLMIEIAISEGRVEAVRSLLNQYSLLLKTDEKGISLLNSLAKYQVLLPKVKRKISDEGNKSSCSNSIQIFATNLVHLAQAEQISQKFTKQPLNTAVCFLPVRYIPLSMLSCSTANQSAILCDESQFYKIAPSVSSRYIAVMLPEGGANVHFGMLYFDAQDGINVIEHEISHLLGFIDEYPLSEGHVRCLANQEEAFSQNIAVLPSSYQGDKSSVRNKVLKQLAWGDKIKETTPILQAIGDNSLNLQYWKLGTPKGFEQEVGLFSSKTCDKKSNEQQGVINAFKPLFKRTKLEYNQVDFPFQYLALLGDYAEQFRMPSFHYNIALAYYQKKNIEQASYWLKQASKWELTHSRRQKVREGRF